MYDMNGTLRNSTRKKVSGARWPIAFNDGYPTKDILLAKAAPILNENRLIGSYRSVSEYLDVHFDLLLEDFICPLRGALQKFKLNKNSTTLNGARVYHNVKLKSLKFRRSELTCKMDIDKTKGTVEPSFGSLLVFTRRGDFQEDFFLATVTSDASKTDVNGLELKLKFPRGFKLDMERLCDNRFTVIEGEAFFYVYFHVLKALNAFDETNFPMKRYIVHGDRETCVKPPAYLTSLTSMKICGHNVRVLDSSEWPSPKELGMDNESQYDALKKALTEEIAFIQGPPGTGKTYFGVSLVKILLDNESVWNQKGSTPLLIVCQSNQALDHFLEKLLPYSNKIVRVGDQCQSAKLKKKSLKELVCRNAAESFNVNGLRTHLESLDKTRKQIKLLTQGIVSFKILEKYGIITEKMSSLFKSEETYLEWLGMHVKAERKSAHESDTDLIARTDELTQHIHQLELSGEYLLSVSLRKDLDIVRKIIRAFKRSVRQDCIWNMDTVLQLTPPDAQNVYLSWMDKFHALLNGKVEVMENELNTFWTMLLPFQRYNATLEVLKSASVVGMTSTGAASRHHILEELASPIGARKNSEFCRGHK